MTVADLIAALQKLDPTLPVLATYADMYGHDAIVPAKRVRVRKVTDLDARDKGVVIE